MENKKKYFIWFLYRPARKAGRKPSSTVLCLSKFLYRPARKAGQRLQNITEDGAKFLYRPARKAGLWKYFRSEGCGSFYTDPLVRRVIHHCDLPQHSHVFLYSPARKAGRLIMNEYTVVVPVSIQTRS